MSIKQVFPFLFLIFTSVGSCEDFTLKYFELKLLNIHNLLQKWLNQRIHWGNAITSRQIWQKLWTTCQDLVNLKIVWDKVYDEMTNTKCVHWIMGLPLFRYTPHIPILQPSKYYKTVFSLFWWLLANSQYWLTILWNGNWNRILGSSKF